MIELSHKPLIRAYRMDCMDFMADKPDGCYELCICDPPYGINYKSFSGNGTIGKANKAPLKYYKFFNDQEKPSLEYFEEIQRISKNQIIWGGNHFADCLPVSSCWLIWDKEMTGGPGVGFCGMEIAWTSFNYGLRKFRYRWNGMLQQNMAAKEIRIHPTQKPVSLYRWLLTNYAKPGQMILDTHGGSFSSAIACWHEGYDMDIVEIDKEYFEAACERFERETRQLKLFGHGL